MLLVTQEKIVKHVYRAWSDLAKPLGRESLTHSEGIQLFRTFFGPGGVPVGTIFATNMATVIPMQAQQALSGLNPAQFDELLARLDTEEKFEAWLLSLPEPSPETREWILQVIDAVVPGLRELLTAKGKQFHYDRGGHPKKFTAEEERQIRKEINRRRGPEVSLETIFAALAKSRDVDESTIKRAWLDGKSDLDDVSGAGEDTVK